MRRIPGLLETKTVAALAADTTRHVAFEIKAVNVEERTIEGYASIFGNIDRTDDIVEAKAFERTLREKRPEQIAVLVAHDTKSLPVGIPLDLRIDARGLWTKTRIFPTTAGNDLLTVASELTSVGQSLGMSFTYRVLPGGASYERVGAKTIRRITDLEMVEYGFAVQYSTANPEAVVTGVKTLDGETDDLVALADALRALADDRALDVAAAARMGLDTKAGKVLSAANLAGLHDAMKTLASIHSAACDGGDGCPVQAKDETGAADTAGAEPDNDEGKTFDANPGYRAQLDLLSLDVAFASAAR